MSLRALRAERSDECSSRSEVEACAKQSTGASKPRVTSKREIASLQDCRFAAFAIVGENALLATTFWGKVSVAGMLGHTSGCNATNTLATETRSHRVFLFSVCQGLSGKVFSSVTHE